MVGSANGSKMMTVRDLTMDPGAASPYHVHPNTEESIFVVEGEILFKIGNHRFTAVAGDCALAPRGVGHGIANASDLSARVITMYPHPSPEREIIEEPQFDESDPKQGFFSRKQTSPFEFMPGVSRYDMIGDFSGAESTYFSELTFAPGATATNHYHPAHEESMFCLQGELTAVYGNDDNIPLPAGDIFLCEPTVRHGVYNSSKTEGKLLAMHPVLNPPPRVDVD